MRGPTGRSAWRERLFVLAAGVLFVRAKAPISLVNMPQHAQFAGRPTGIPVVRKCVEYAKQHEGVWFARQGDIARRTFAREEDVKIEAA